MSLSLGNAGKQLAKHSMLIKSGGRRKPINLCFRKAYVYDEPYTRRSQISTDPKFRVHPGGIWMAKITMLSSKRSRRDDYFADFTTSKSKEMSWTSKYKYWTNMLNVGSPTAREGYGDRKVVVPANAGFNRSGWGRTLAKIEGRRSYCVDSRQKVTN